MKMSMLCFFQGHSPSDDQVWNRGYSFSRCRRCRCDLIRSDAEWQTVPRGHRVVWKEGRHEHSRPAAYVRNLPVLYRGLRGGVPAAWRGGWQRRILALADGGSRNSAALEEARPYPNMLAFFAIAGAGLQVLLAGPRSRHNS